MAHFAKVQDSDGLVLDVIVAEQDFIDSLDAEEGVSWIQTSYNTRGGVHYEPDSDTPSADQSQALRKNFASVGAKYYADADAFEDLKKYTSWVLNTETYIHESPLPRPAFLEGEQVYWDEDLYNSSGGTEGWVVLPYLGEDWVDEDPEGYEPE